MRSVIGRLKKSFFSAMDARYLRRLKSSENHGARELARILERYPSYDPVPGNEVLRGVEHQRRQWLSCDDPLVDGTLGASREWDDGVSVRGACEASKDPRPAAFLHLLTHKLRPATVIELGTNVGISSAYLSDALTTAGSSGRLYTLEASPYRLRLARELHGLVGLDNIVYREGLFVDTLQAALAEVGTVDLAFIDGHHRYRPTLDYFEMVCSRLGSESVVVFDDIRLNDEMRRAWRELVDDRRIAAAVDLYSIGVCCMADPDGRGPHLVVPPISYALQHRDLGLRDVLIHLPGATRRRGVRRRDVSGS